MSERATRRRFDPGAVGGALLLLLLSAGYESLFLRHGLNRLDAAWPLYAAMQLHAGGTLYRDVFFVFPPGHLLAAWIAWALDPPGIVLARTFYAAWNVALCLGLFALGRKVMPTGFAFFGAALLAVAAPHSHLAQFHFGYRYLALTVPALLALHAYLRAGDRRWLALAGASIGLTACFRVTPALATAAAVGLGLAAAARSADRLVREAGWLAAGVLAVMAPALLWWASGVGLETLWREVLVRPVAMTELQSFPVPPLERPERWDRVRISVVFVAVQYRLYALLYAGYAVALAWRRLRGRRDDAFLVALVAWGGIFFFRSFGRADQAHLESAIPPACLLLAHAASIAARRLRALASVPLAARRAGALAAAGAALAAWILLQGSDRALDPAFVGDWPFRPAGGAVSVRAGANWARILDHRSEDVRSWTEPGDRVLDLTASPIFHILTDRAGPGGADVIMPGTFLGEAEERAFVERLEARPPALVIWPAREFDDRAERAVERTAPLVVRWVRERYEPFAGRNVYVLMRPRP